MTDTRTATATPVEDRITRDLNRILPNGFDVVFDVGANVGQSTQRFRTAWPTASIYAFEPVRQTFCELEKKFGGIAGVTCENFALGAIPGPALITANDSSTMNSLVGARHKGPTETIDVKTGDYYCEQRGVDRINFLKIDTEGHDLSVLVGLIRMTAEHRIDFLQVEAGMNPDNTRHVNISRFLGLLEPLGYHIFGVYDQVREKRAKATLRRANLVFARKSLAG